MAWNQQIYKMYVMQKKKNEPNRERERVDEIWDERTRVKRG